MKRVVLSFLLPLGLSFSVIACANDAGYIEIATPDPAPNPGTGKYLVVYYSRSGNTRAIANEIASQTGGRLVEVVPTIAYPSGYDATLARAREEINSIEGCGTYPSIYTIVDDFDDYDVVFVCAPLWYGRMAIPMQAFLNEHGAKLAGKPIALAVTSSTTGISRVVSDAMRLCTGSTFEGEPLWVRASQLNDADELIAAWLASMNLNQDNKVGKFDLSRGENGDPPTIKLSSGYDMPIVGLGTYSLTGDDCINSVMSAIRRGFRKFDTAHMYNNEEEVGEAIRRSGIPREEIFVCTKLYPNQFADADNAIELALKKLDIGYIDLMLLHHPGTNDVAAYKAMERAVIAGKIRSVGLSNYYIKEMGEFLPQVTIKPVLVQNEIHPYYQDAHVIEYMHQQGIVVEAWYPLGGRGHTAALFKDPVIADIAKSHGRSSAQVILRWELQRGVVVIPGSSNPEHQSENISIFDFALSDAEMNRIGTLNRNEKHDWY